MARPGSLRSRTLGGAWNTAKDSRSAVSRELISDWSSLLPGDRVLVMEMNRQESTGLVDVMTADAAIIWLALDAGCGRRLFTVQEGCQIWRIT